MARDSFDYGRMIAHALRDVARQALHRTAEEGLPGEHHFYLSFRTGSDGVRVPGFLRDQYPDEMTVVLQNQFWDLEVDHQAFSVSLTFNGARQRIVVPFDALTAFADPSAQLGLRFEPPAPGTADGEGAEGSGEGQGGGTGPRAAASPFGAGASPFTGVAGAEVAEGNEAEGGASGGDAGDAGDDEAGGGGAEVVHLDRFRRRNGGEDGEPADAPDASEDEGAEPADGAERPPGDDA